MYIYIQYIYISIHIFVLHNIWLDIRISGCDTRCHFMCGVNTPVNLQRPQTFGSSQTGICLSAFRLCSTKRTCFTVPVFNKFSGPFRSGVSWMRPGVLEKMRVTWSFFFCHFFVPLDVPSQKLTWHLKR